MACCLLTLATGDGVAADTPRPSTGLSVRCVVPAAVVTRVRLQMPVLPITEDDVARGFVEAPAASRLSVTTNARNGYAFDFAPRLPIFKSVRVRTNTGSGELGPDGGTLVERGRSGRDLPTEISYRFVLADGVAPGEYPWPLALVVRPL
jgi:hypothetical protein